MRRFVLAFTLVGPCIPIVWMAIYHLSPPFAKWWFSAPLWLEIVRFGLWPVSVLLMAEPHDSNVTLWVTSALINAAVYALLASLLGHAFRRHP